MISTKRILSVSFDAITFGYTFLMMSFCLTGFNVGEQISKRTIEIFVASFVAGLFFSIILDIRNIESLGKIIFNQSTSRKITKLQNFWKIQAAFLFLISFVLAYFVTKISVTQLLEKDSFDHAMNLFSQMARPDWQILPKAVSKIIETVLIAFMATTLALPIAFVLSFFSAKNLMSQNKFTMMIYFSLRLFFNIMRSVEPILWAIVFSIWVGFGPYAGMLALFVHSIASLTKQFSEIIEGVDEAPIEAISSTGANRIQITWFAIIPQVILPFISFTIYRWDINVRMATIIGFVGGGGIGATLLEAQGQAQWSQVGCIIVVIAFVVWIMDSFSAYVRQAIK